MPSQVFNSKRHDTGYSLAMTFTVPDDVTWNLSESGISVKFIARLPGSPTPKVNASAVVTGGWAVRYDPAPEDVNTIGAYDVEVEITRSNGKKLTLPTVDYLQWIIQPDLDNA
jgi:hypothetical protein